MVSTRTTGGNRPPAIGPDHRPCPPESGIVSAVLFTDGACSPNPGNGAAAWVLRRNGEILSSGAHCLDKTTNNIAEYYGLIYGLEAALALGVRQIEAYSDSELVVQQVNGRWRCRKAHLKALQTRAQALLAGFGSWSLDWIPRSRNDEADALANRAAKEQLDIDGTDG